MGGGEISADVETGDYNTIVQEKDKLCCNNYRGVSLLSHCGTIMIRVILHRIRQKRLMRYSVTVVTFKSQRSQK